MELRTNLSSYGAIPPIGLAYVAAVLRKAGHDVTVMDGPGEAIQQYTEMPSPVGVLHCNGLTPEQMVARLSADTQIVGITHMFLHEWPTIRRLCELIRSQLPDTVIVIGGENATAFWDVIFKECPAVNYCVLGEGEFTMVELIERLMDGRDPLEIRGVAGRTSIRNESSQKKIIDQLSPRTLELGEIPWPAWDLFPVDNYMIHADHHGVNRGRSMPILATRGCPFQCTFCSSPSMWTTRYKTRDPKDVVSEMKTYVEKFRVDNFNFCDLTAIIKKEWIVEFCNLLKTEKVNVTWQLPTGTRSEALDNEVLGLVYETGCRNITYAPESGSERMLDVIKKRVKIPRMLESLRMAYKNKLVTRVNIIIGHPQEKHSDTWKSLGFLIQCAWVGCQDAAVMIFAPYPGSEDTRTLVEHGKVTIGEDYYYLALARSGWSSRTYNPWMSTRELILMQFFMLSVFYAVAYMIRPWRIIQAAQSIFTGNEQTQLDQLLRTKLQRSTVLSKAISRLGKLLSRFFQRT